MRDTLTGPDRMGNRLPPGALVAANPELAVALAAVVADEIAVDDVPAIVPATADHPFEPWHPNDPHLCDLCAVCSDLRENHDDQGEGA